jgi:hypothetical protein
VEAVFQPPQTLRPERGQPFAVLVQVHQREARAEMIVVLLQAAETHFYESEDALQDAERVLHLGSHSGRSRVLAPGLFIHIVLESGAAAE